jgi:triosephosphate isomerase
MTVDRPVIFAGNWKMHKTISEAVSYLRELLACEFASNSLLYIAPPFTAIHAFSQFAKESPVLVGGQNMHDAEKGAFTGEISASMLLEAGAEFVILGHSERRQIFDESSEFINRKVKRALDKGLQPIFCFGETLEQRERGEAFQVLEKQILEGLKDVKDLKNMIFAYEPVWAIGTGVSATPEQAQEVHAFCRKLIAGEWGSAVAEKTAILYGGSVKTANAKALIQELDIDGFLVGGASLDTVETKACLEILFNETAKAKSELACSSHDSNEKKQDMF